MTEYKTFKDILSNDIKSKSTDILNLLEGTKVEDCNTILDYVRELIYRNSHLKAQ